jgi:hypothetical protein
MEYNRRFATPFRHSVATLLVGGMLALAPATHALSIDSEIAYTNDDNVTRAQRDSDILNDQFVSVSAGLTYVGWLNMNHRVIYRGFLRAEIYDKYDGLSNNTAGVNLNYQYRAAGTITAPTYGAFIKAAIAEYDSDLRDSNLYSAGVSWRKPFSDRITFTTILAGNVRDSDSTVFDTKEVSLLANVDYLIGSRWTLYLTLNYLDGDVVSTAVPGLAVVNAAEAINADDAFGGAAANRFAYRLDAQTNVVTLGTNISFGEQHSLDVSARWADSKATGGISYERRLFSAAYLIRF